MSALIRRMLIALPFVIVAWITLFAVVLRLGGPAPALVVLFPPEDLVDALNAEVAITGVTRFSITLANERDDTLGDVYDTGAWLVLPAGLEGCIRGR